MGTLNRREAAKIAANAGLVAGTLVGFGGAAAPDNTPGVVLDAVEFKGLETGHVIAVLRGSQLQGKVKVTVQKIKDGVKDGPGEDKLIQFAAGREGEGTVDLFKRGKNTPDPGTGFIITAFIAGGDIAAQAGARGTGDLTVTIKVEKSPK